MRMNVNSTDLSQLDVYWRKQRALITNTQTQTWDIALAEIALEAMKIGENPWNITKMPLKIVNQK